jgi:mannose-6-phosphate isomerase-like protein (cupin superfamily)
MTSATKQADVLGQPAQKEHAMHIIRGNDIKFVPASHERPDEPGVLKRVLVHAEDIINGRVQMINWALLPAGNSFQAHYHEDMQEIFILVQGRTQISIEDETGELNTGDAVFIPVAAVHTMHNPHAEDAAYIAIGITQGRGGKTVVVEG